MLSSLSCEQKSGNSEKYHEREASQSLYENDFKCLIIYSSYSWGSGFPQDQLLSSLLKKPGSVFVPVAMILPSCKTYSGYFLLWSHMLFIFPARKIKNIQYNKYACWDLIPFLLLKCHQCSFRTLASNQPQMINLLVSVGIDKRATAPIFRFSCSSLEIVSYPYLYLMPINIYILIIN